MNLKHVKLGWPVGSCFIFIILAVLFFRHQRYVTFASADGESLFLSNSPRGSIRMFEQDNIRVRDVLGSGNRSGRIGSGELMQRKSGRETYKRISRPKSLCSYCAATETGRKPGANGAETGRTLKQIILAIGNTRLGSSLILTMDQKVGGSSPPSPAT